MPQATDRLLTARESAAALVVSIPTFYRLLNGGRIPKPIRIGSHPRWPESEIQGVIDAAKQQRAA